jgi:4-hydroxy-3-methylbut-2-enyl diphosphate reductase
LAKQFGFCYGVERAIDLAYAARKVFPDRRISLLGEIIHNPEVNAQLAAMGIRYLPAHPDDAQIQELVAEDVVIVPAFGAKVSTVDAIKERGCQIVDTTCGDVMSVWKRVRQNASEQVTSIIHGKAAHEKQWPRPHVLSGPKARGTISLISISIRRIVFAIISATAETRPPFSGILRVRIRPALIPTSILSASAWRTRRQCCGARPRKSRREFERRSARGTATANFRFFDTICGATQERQDALFQLLDETLDLLIVVGGYNSSNTTHLAEIGERTLPTWFIRNAGCMISAQEIRHFDIHRKEEVATVGWLPGVSSVRRDNRRRKLPEQSDRRDDQPHPCASQ